jgi:hypothetical protein
MTLRFMGLESATSGNKPKVWPVKLHPSELKSVWFGGAFGFFWWDPYKKHVFLVFYFILLTLGQSSLNWVWSSRYQKLDYIDRI